MAEYQGKKVSLNKPFRTPKEKKKFAVYVKKNDKVIKVRFGSRERMTGLQQTTGVANNGDVRSS